MNKAQFINRVLRKFSSSELNADQIDMMYRRYLSEQEEIFQMQMIYESQRASEQYSTAAVGSGPQFPGDYRSVGSGDWNNPSSWQRLEGTSWVPAKTPPGSINDVYIQIGHTLTMTADGQCRDLNLNSDIIINPNRLATQSYTLSVYGKLRTYAGAINVIPGTDSLSVNNSKDFVNTSPNGKIKITGTSRIVTYFGQWGVPNNFNGWNLEIAMDSPNDTAVFETNMRAGTITVASGTLLMDRVSGGALRPDDGVAASGTLNVFSGASLVMNNTTIARVATGRFGTFNLEEGGNLILPAGTSNNRMAATTLNLRGNVISNNGTLPGNGGIAGAASFTTYNNLTMNVAHTFSTNITVNGVLTLGAKLTSSASFKPTIGPSGSISGASSTNYIDGPLGILVESASKTLNFEIGKESSYRKVGLYIEHDSSTSTTYTAEVFNTAPTSRTLPPSLTNVSSVRYWNIVKGSGASVTAAQISLDYGSDDGVTGGSKIAVENGSAWADIGGTGSIGATGTITSTSNFTTFGDFVLADVI